MQQVLFENKWHIHIKMAYLYIISEKNGVITLKKENFRPFYWAF